MSKHDPSIRVPFYGDNLAQARRCKKLVIEEKITSGGACLQLVDASKKRPTVLAAVSLSFIPFFSKGRLDFMQQKLYDHWMKGGEEEDKEQ